MDESAIIQSFHQFEKGTFYGKAHKKQNVFSLLCIIIGVANCLLPIASGKVSQKDEISAGYFSLLLSCIKGFLTLHFTFLSLKNPLTEKGDLSHCSSSSSQASSMAESSSVQGTSVHSNLLTIKPQ